MMSRYRLGRLTILSIACLLAATVWLPRASVGHASAGSEAAAPLPMVGVNLASGEFAPERLPGVHGKDYIYPGASTAQPFLSAGFNTVRIPVVWERLQPSPLGPLDEAEMARLDRSFAALQGFRTIILDLHNYGRYRGAALDSSAGAAMLADFWTRIAKRYGSSPAIAFGLMNEPHGISASTWRAIAESAVEAIRSAGARNLILVPGTRWTGAHSWATGSPSNADAFRGFSDPANNFVFEVHQYLDSDSSGQSGRCVSGDVGSRRLAAFTTWARGQKARAVLGEFGGSSDATCLSALDDMLAFMSRNSDVWAGWTYWAGGDWWGSYPFSIQPSDSGEPKPQMKVLQRHVVPAHR